MKESRKEVIKKMHEYASDAYKLIIEKEFPKLFKKEDKANGWYKDTTCDKWCMFFENGIMKYGVSTLGLWLKDLNTTYILSDEDYKATNEEVEQAHIKEAKKIGFDKEGISFKIIEGPSTGSVNLTKITNQYVIKYESSRNRVVLVKNSISYTICINGKWAEIIKETITKEQYIEASNIIYKYERQ
jgi:predicted small secreted protein